MGGAVTCGRGVLVECGCTGIDVYSGKLPGKMDMLRLLMNPDIRDSATKMAAAFQEAGIDMSKVRDFGLASAACTLTVYYVARTWYSRS